MSVNNAGFVQDSIACKELTPGTLNFNMDGIASVAGTATLAAGTVTITTSNIAEFDAVQFTHLSNAGTIGVLSVGTITTGTSFTIDSLNPVGGLTQTADTSVVSWFIQGRV